MLLLFIFSKWKVHFYPVKSPFLSINLKDHDFLLTVSMSLRFSISCLLSLISLDATHVLIWSRRRWGPRRRRRRGREEKEEWERKSGRQTHQSLLGDMQKLIFNGHGRWRWCVREEACGAWLGVWSSWQHGAGSRRTKHNCWLRKMKFNTPRSTPKHTAGISKASEPGY